MAIKWPAKISPDPMPREVFLHCNDVVPTVYDILGKNAEKIVPGYRYMVSWKDLYPTYGDFTDFTDNVVGGRITTNPWASTTAPAAPAWACTSPGASPPCMSARACVGISRSATAGRWGAASFVSICPDLWSA